MELFVIAVGRVGVEGWGWEGAFDEFNTLPCGSRGVPVCVSVQLQNPRLALVKNRF